LISFHSPRISLPTIEGLADGLESIRRFRRAPQQFRIEANERFVSAELERFEQFFDEAEKKPLTDAQRLAVITHEDNTRVIAGAGSGKTAVMAVKAAYLIERELCRTDELLLVAFNRSAAQELGERTEAIVGVPVKATTFHALGLGIIGEVTAKKPMLAKSAEDPVLLKKEIREIIEAVVKHPEQGALVRTYFQSFFAPYRSSEEFQEIGDYYAYLKNLEIRTIRDERLRSFEEVEIANFLFLNGIAYEYERPYKVDLATSVHRQYQPDFFLSEYDIYIEHFGIGRDGSTAPHIPAEQYRATMEWKRSIHREHDTALVETYSYMKREGTLIETLRRELEEWGVEFRPISDEVLLKELNRSNQLDPFTSLIATFLDHFKGNGLDVAEVRRMAAERGVMDPRLDAFLGVFDPVFEQYQQGLQSRKQIDFNDMIAQAVSLVTEGSYRSPYRCVLVDEFQDISSGRARLVRALADQDAESPPVRRRG
jgi:DNA helicase IV